jgi:hypothetical protein
MQSMWRVLTSTVLGIDVAALLIAAMVFVPSAFAVDEGGDGGENLAQCSAAPCNCTNKNRGDQCAGTEGSDCSSGCMCEVVGSFNQCTN